MSKELYRPPGARGTSAILKFLEEREPPSNPKAFKPSKNVNFYFQFMFYFLFFWKKGETSPHKSKSDKRSERKKKPAVASCKSNKLVKDSEVSDDKTKPILEFPLASNIQLELTGDKPVDKKLKDLKKVGSLKLLRLS